MMLVKFVCNYLIFFPFNDLYFAGATECLQHYFMRSCCYHVRSSYMYQPAKI